ncbi:hypothetical protein SRABI106_03172 [Rahnella aquatilis]|nr:hypothetical protein SRABI106_03172 [Rahnella aquatilis]
MLVGFINSFRYITGNFNYFGHFALFIFHRNIICLKPDYIPVFVYTFNISADRLSLPQTFPVKTIRIAGNKLRGAENPVRLTNHLVSAVPHAAEKQVVNLKHHAFRRESDHRNRLLDRSEFITPYRTKLMRK